MTGGGEEVGVQGEKQEAGRQGCSPFVSLSFSSLLHSLPGANELLMAVETGAMDQSSISLCVSLPPPLSLAPTCPPPFALSPCSFWQRPSFAGCDSPPSLFVSRFQETEREA